MYFSNFPKIYYDFPQDSTSTSLQILTDITTNVRVRKEILENITLYDEYDMQEGETPEIVAEKVYGNPELHWVIMLVNQRYDYLKDFPMTSSELYEYTKQKYGEDFINEVHHYEKNGIITEARATLKVPVNIISSIKINDYISNLPYANSRVESIDISNSSINVLVDFGSYKTNQLVSVRGIRYNNSTKKYDFSSIINFNIPNNAFTINELYSTITNYTYEVRENEKKRRIKLISKQLIDQIVREFQNLVIV